MLKKTLHLNNVLTCSNIFYFCTGFYRKSHPWLTCGVIGNTSDFGSEEFRFEPWQVNKKSSLMRSGYSGNLFRFAPWKMRSTPFNAENLFQKLSCGVIGNTSDSGSEEFRFEPWQDNTRKPRKRFFCFCPFMPYLKLPFLSIWYGPDLFRFSNSNACTAWTAVKLFGYSS